MKGGALGRRTVLVIGTLLVFWRAFTVFFAVDDFAFLARAAGPASLPPDLATVFSHRYLSSDVLYRLCVWLFGAHAGLFHVVTIGLHLLNAELVFVCVLRLLGSRPVATVASFVFAVHPAAYTPVIWVAAGFNEIPVVTLSLCSVLLVESDVRVPRAWKIAATLGCLAVATAFKQHALLMPIQWVATVAWLSTTGRAGPAAWRRLAIGGSLAVLFYVYVWFAVLPGMRTLFAGPYERVFELSSVLGTLARYYLAVLNPLPLLREPLGGQIPWIDPSGLTMVGRAVGAGVAAIVFGLLLAGPATADRRRLAWGAAACVLGLLLLPATMPRHVYEYYVYSAVPMASLVLAVMGVSLAEAWAGASRPLRVGLVGLVAVLLAAEGFALHATSGIGAQAARARAIDEVMHRLSDRTQVVVVPPSDGAHEDTAYGMSIEALHGHRGIHVRFASTQDPPVASGPRLQLLAVDRLGERTAIRFVDNAAWAHDGAAAVLAAGRAPALQRIRVGAGDLVGIQLPLQPLGPLTCTLEWTLAGARGQLVAGRVPCAQLAERLTTVEMPGALRIPPGDYVLRLAVDGAGAIRVPTGRVRPSGAVVDLGEPDGPAVELVHRVIVGAPIGGRP